MKKHKVYKNDSEQIDLKAAERKEYQDFIERRKLMLGRGKIEQTSDDSDDEEEKLMRTRIQKLQAKMTDEENIRKAKEAEQMECQMKLIKLEEEKLEKERKKMQRLSLLQKQQERMERHIQMKIRKQMEEEQYLKKLKEEGEYMKLSFLQKKSHARKLETRDVKKRTWKSGSTSWSTRNTSIPRW